MASSPSSRNKLNTNLCKQNRHTLPTATKILRYALNDIGGAVLQKFPPPVILSE
ncbi:hypothetical protein JYT16_00125 [Gemmatimonas aurantiaca]|nr:hypothetical protein [Gemmatimonas aurantiaca]